ncbi:hypothetical protein FH609_012605 [Streptomyces sp. 3MP-14]|uniref:Uncharacterized protein n=1 Tax=Streptomyces mimosae TaxID=2586635 RepID=A0A5N6AHD5_9ACTN|nr:MULTISPECIES: hypothetical protein [Streptomyces]KAB8167219.1 hypothetical protein FH607_010055 [Streptomyces mimosae]KAB8177160.1 hypothetical protein FH609_012605 [Streptomyces sp. 3MP-14]
MSQGQGGPQWVPGGDARPDWNRLAADADKQRAKKRWTIIGTCVGAAVVIGTVVALAIVSQGDDEGGATAGTATTLPESTAESDDAEPTFGETTLPPVPSAREFISDAEKDTAPFDVGGFYGEDPMEVDDRSYALAASDGSEDCASLTTGGLASLLEEQGCAGLLRATYVGGGVAVTVGVAQLPSEEAAAAVHGADELSGTLQALPGGDAGTLCERGGCRTTRNQVGRYVYLTIAGNADGSPDSGDGTAAQQAARDGNDHAFSQIIRRGETQASASASAIVEERRRSQS